MGVGKKVGGIRETSLLKKQHLIKAEDAQHILLSSPSLYAELSDGGKGSRFQPPVMVFHINIVEQLGSFILSYHTSSTKPLRNSPGWQICRKRGKSKLCQVVACNAFLFTC